MRTEIGDEGEIGVKGRVADELLEGSKVRRLPAQQRDQPLSRIIAPERQTSLIYTTELQVSNCHLRGP